MYHLLKYGLHWCHQLCQSLLQCDKQTLCICTVLKNDLIILCLGINGLLTWLQSHLLFKIHEHWTASVVSCMLSTAVTASFGIWSLLVFSAGRLHKDSVVCNMLFVRANSCQFWHCRGPFLVWGSSTRILWWRRYFKLRLALFNFFLSGSSMTRFWVVEFYPGALSVQLQDPYHFQLVAIKLFSYLFECRHDLPKIWILVSPSATGTKWNAVLSVNSYMLVEILAVGLHVMFSYAFLTIHTS